MRIGIVVDSTCDLPEAYYQEHNIRILPISIRLGDELLVDKRGSADTARFYRDQLDAKGRDAESIPFSVDQIRSVFLEELVLDYDLVFCITVSGKRSQIFDNATQASFSILKEYQKVRADAGVPGPFSMRVIDSKTLFSGTAVLVCEAVELIRSGANRNAIRLNIDQMIPHICGYMVPEDLGYVRDRGFKKGERKRLSDSMRGLALTVGSALSMHPVIRIHGGEENPATVNRSYEKSVRRLFEHVAGRIRGGHLISRHVCLSYAGDMERVPAMPGYGDLKAAADDKGIKLLVSTMSPTGAINVGAGCLFVAYASENDQFD
ncbi:DegV family protein [Alloalcanivorax gelatiniphagus]|uniref:DegV family EDD domain-containing protein n=1 Tax=Alloalcanivorax gelatiniphagus TaxID=1194167 RepID=A0ABY2XMQ9_9GAMM|nr:DegV family protein [Alloalcanivorax gelatiniphagus]TMW12988.1 DegV family EDD domain-containing protein [Alloalcanivorax gelatiniphagus]